MEKLLKDPRWTSEKYKLEGREVVKLKDKIKIGDIVKSLGEQEKEQVSSIVSKINSCIDEFLSEDFKIKVQTAMGMKAINDNTVAVRNRVSDIIGECQTSRKLLNECVDSMKMSFENLESLEERLQKKLKKSKSDSSRNQRRKDVLDVLSNMLSVKDKIISETYAAKENLKKQLQEIKTLAFDEDISVLSQKTTRNCLARMSNALRHASKKIKNEKSECMVQTCENIWDWFMDEKNKDSYEWNRQRIEKASKGSEISYLGDKVSVVISVENAARSLAQETVVDIGLGKWLTLAKSGKAKLGTIAEGTISITLNKIHKKLKDLKGKLDIRKKEAIINAERLGLVKREAELVFDCAYQAEAGKRQLRVWEEIYIALRKKIVGINIRKTSNDEKPEWGVLALVFSASLLCFASAVVIAVLCSVVLASIVIICTPFVVMTASLAGVAIFNGYCEKGIDGV